MGLADVDYNWISDAFCIEESELEGCTFLYAEYEQESYEGSAFVIFVKNGIIYEVHGGHCSCYGLEGQWVPEERTPLALLSRPDVNEVAKNNIKEFYDAYKSMLN